MDIVFTDAELKIIHSMSSKYLTGKYTDEEKAYALIMAMPHRPAAYTGTLMKLIATLPKESLDDILFVNKRVIRGFFESSAPLTRALGVYGRNFAGFPSWRANANLEVIMYIGAGGDDRSISVIRKRDLTTLMKTFRPLIRADKNPVKANVACGMCGCGKPTMMDTCVICGNRGM